MTRLFCIPTRRATPKSPDASCSRLPGSIRHRDLPEIQGGREQWRPGASAVALHTARSSPCFRRFIPEPVTERSCGRRSGESGGDRALTKALSGITVKRFADVYFDGEAKEAVASRSSVISFFRTSRATS